MYCEHGQCRHKDIRRAGSASERERIGMRAAKGGAADTPRDPPGDAACPPDSSIQRSTVATRAAVIMRRVAAMTPSKLASRADRPRWNDRMDGSTDTTKSADLPPGQE